MKISLQVYCLGILFLCAACQEHTIVANETETKVSDKQSVAEETITPTMTILEESAYTNLLNTEKQFIGIVRCLEQEIINKGTRSEQEVCKVELYTVGVGKDTKIFKLHRYVQTSPYFEAGRLYIVAAYEEWENNYSVTGFAEIEEAVVASSLKNAVAAFESTQATSPQ